MNQNTGANNNNMSSPSSPMLANTPLNLSSPSLSSAGSLTPQAQPQGQAQQSQQSTGGIQQQQQQQQQRRTAHTFPRITPQQAHQLLRQFNIEKEGAQRAGINTPEGKQHVRKAERIKAILIQYNRKQKMLAAQRQQRREAQIQAEQRTQQQQSPQQGATLGGMIDSTRSGQGQGQRGANLDAHIQQQQQIQQAQQIQQSQQVQQAQQTQRVQQGQQAQNNGSPQSQQQQAQQRTGNSSKVDLGSLTPAQQLQIQRQQQLAKYRQIIKLAEQFRNQLRAIEARKNVPNTPANLIAQLNQKEQEIKSRMEQCRGYAQQIANRIRLMQQRVHQNQRQMQQQQQQSNAAQNFGTPIPSGNSQGTNTSAQPQQFQGKLTSEQKHVLQQRILLEQQKRLELSRQNQQNSNQQQQDILSQVTNAISAGSMPAQVPGQNLPQVQPQQPSSSSASTTKTKKKTQRKNQKKNAKTQTKKLTKAQKKLLKQNEAAAAAAKANDTANGATTTADSAASAVQTGAAAAGTSSANIAAPKSGNKASGTPQNIQGPQITVAMPGTADSGSDTPRPRFQNITIPQDLKVSVPSGVSVKVNNRPTLLGGNATDSPALSNPAFIRPQHFEFEGGRVLNKRKLRELVKYVASEEGDTDVAIDGDVEDLLLDLADEFVTSVTSFACRLAKHRKSNSLDVKDVQLHLERNWNIRVPGYAADEIRSTRKLMPNPAHNSKINGLSINKSVNKGK